MVVSPNQDGQRRTEPVSAYRADEEKIHLETPAAPVVVEFFGVPRLRAGRATLQVPAGTLDGALAEVCRQCPRLDDLLDAGGQVSAHYLLSLDGRHFVSRLDHRLEPGDRLLVLSADSGG